MKEKFRRTAAAARLHLTEPGHMGLMSREISSSASILNEVLHTFLVSSDSERAINRILERVGRHFSVSRVYIFENSGHEATFSNTYEWCNEGIAPEKEHLQRIPLSVLEGYYHVFNADNVFCASDISKLPDYLIDILSPQGIKALLQVALVVNDQKMGMVGFDDCHRVREWSRDEISTLSILAQILNVFILNHRTDQRSRLNKNLAFTIINNLESLVYVIDVETYNLLYVNEKLVDIVPEIELGQPCYKFLMPDSSEPCSFCPVRTYLRAPSITRTSFDLHNPLFDLWSEIHSSILEWFDGRKVCFLSANNITEKRHHEIKLEHLAYTDELTGLPNNRRFQRDGPGLLEAAAAQSMNVAVISLKMQSLHRINSTRGYEQGDEILRAFANAANHMLPVNSLFARTRGNDFAILYPYEKQKGRAPIREAIDRICRAASKIRVPTSLHGWLNVRAGISVFPEDGNTFETLNRKAGLALATSDAASGPYVFYDAVVTAGQLARDTLARELALALHNGELELYYQPKVDVRTSRVVGAEALMRWHHPEHGLLPGGAFIELAEERGLISDIDEWVINEACRHIKLLRDAGCAPVPTAINLSPDKFYQEDILTKLASALQRHDVPPKLLEVELTERIALENLEKAISIMHQIRALGIKISIDDFGTGYSSLNYLRRLPIDAVKLDRSFLADIERDAAARKIVGFVVQLAGLLKATVIMEGIETAEQLAFAREIACDVSQGYYTGRPGPLSDLAARLSAGESPAAARALKPASPLRERLALRKWLPPLLGGSAAFLAGMLVDALPDVPALPAEKMLPGLIAAGIAVLGLTGVSAYFGWRYAALYRNCRESIDILIQVCTSLIQGTPNLEHRMNLPAPFKKLGEVMTLTAQKLYAGNMELRERETALEQVNTRLKEEHGKYRIIAEAVSDMLWEVELSSGTMHFSHNFMELTGYTRQVFKYPEEILQYIYPEDQDAWLARMKALARGETPGRGAELRLRLSDGCHAWIRSNGSLIRDEEGRASHLVGAFSNISVLKQQEMLLLERTQRDPLTGLLNRPEGESRVLRALARSGPPRLMFIVGITNFRAINVGYGQDSGDAMLRALGERLARLAGPEDILFRYAGNEFALLKQSVPDSPAPEALAAELLRALNEPQQWRGREIRPDCALSGLVTESGTVEGADVLRRAYENLERLQADGSPKFRVIG